MTTKKVTEDGEVIAIRPPTKAKGAPFWKTPWNHDTDLESLATGLECTDPTKTQQHMEEETDINKMIKKYGIGAVMNAAPMPPTMQDFEEAFDMQESLDLIHQANQSFAKLPPEVRDYFMGDAAKFVAAVDNELAKGKPGLDKLRAWGLAPPEAPEPEPTPPPPKPAPDGDKGGKAAS